MAYIGQKEGGTVSTITSKTLNTMTGDGSDTTLTLSQTPASVNDVAVYLDGVFQRPTNEYTLSGNVITFTTAPANGVFICAVTGGGHDIGSPLDGSVSTDKLIDGTITSAMVATMSSSKLTGALGALDGSALTGIPSSIIKNASDPAIDTNPSGGLGTIWANTTSGEMFILTDATTDENVWTNVGAGTGDVQLNYGFASGGEAPVTNAIERFNFASSSTNTDWGDLTVGRSTGTGSSSTTHGYGAAGQPASSNGTVIDKFALASQSNATDVGDCSGRDLVGGNYSTTDGYVVGGRSSGTQSTIQKFSFSSDGNASSVSTINSGALYHIGQGSNSSTHGYSNGGRNSGNVSVNNIQKFQFSNESTTAQHGNLIVSKRGCAGSSSSTDGYVSGGYSDSPQSTIEKYSFASNTTATSHGSLSEIVYSAAASYTSDETVVTQGYGSGYTAAKQKFSFASNTTAEDIGDLSTSAAHTMGHGLAR